jgi:hypothetical protein
MRRTLDPRVGSGALIGLAHAHGDPDEDIARNDTSDPQGATRHEARTSDIDDSVVAILESLTADGSSELAVPDSATRAQRMLTQAGGAHDQALVAWDVELHHREAQLAVVETAKWYVPRALAAALIVIGVIGVMSAVFIIDAPGRASSWWIVALCLFINAFVLERCARDMRRWRRVHRNWRVERAAWLEWRSHLGANAADPADVRNIPYAAATGNVENVARVLAAPSTVGLHAVTPQTISTLRLFGGANGAE